MAFKIPASMQIIIIMCMLLTKQYKLLSTSSAAYMTIIISLVQWLHVVNVTLIVSSHDT